MRRSKTGDYYLESLHQDSLNVNFVGMDLVEVSPPFDHAEITSMAAATVAHDWICIMANQKRKLNL